MLSPDWNLLFIFSEFHPLSDEPEHEEPDDEENVEEHLDFLEEQGDEVDLPLIPRDGSFS